MTVQFILYVLHFTLFFCLLFIHDNFICPHVTPNLYCVSFAKEKSFSKTLVTKKHWIPLTSNTSTQGRDMRANT